jgi:hypothetical protein
LVKKQLEIRVGPTRHPPGPLSRDALVVGQASLPGQWDLRARSGPHRGSGHGRPTSKMCSPESSTTGPRQAVNSQLSAGAASSQGRLGISDEWHPAVTQSAREGLHGGCRVICADMISQIRDRCNADHIAPKAADCGMLEQRVGERLGRPAVSGPSASPRGPRELGAAVLNKAPRRKVARFRV